MSLLRISHYERETEFLGPGKRFVIWFQGCNKRCKGCINPEGRNIDGGYSIDVNEMLSLIIKTPSIQGVTISGGEPFLQFSALYELVYLVKANLNLDIMLFSGYKFEDIKEEYSEVIIKDFFSKIDIFIDGEYIEELNDDQMYRGSSNQNIYFFTNKYIEYKNDILNAKNRNVEFTIDEDTNVFMVGIPPKDFYNEFISNIKKEADSND